MKKRFLKITVLFASVALILSACEKDEDLTPSNPLNGKTTAIFNDNVSYGTMTDLDGNVYKTVTIGDQTWMAENLRTTTYNDGTAISYAADSAEWINLSTGGYCNYNNTTNEEAISTYGRLYNNAAVHSGKLAPTGWHVPTDEEWKTLITYLGDEAGGKLKETGTTHWNSPNTGATNETGFTALPGGSIGYDAEFGHLGESGCWWGDYFTLMSHEYSFTDYTVAPHQFGGSVRCVMN